MARNPGNVFVLKAEDIVPGPAFAALPAAAGVVTGAGAVVDDHDDVTPGTPIAALGTSPCLRILVSHGDCVEALPPGATHLARSPSCTNEVFAVGRSVIAMQSHPEFDLDFCIKTKIWPAVVDERKRLTEEQVADSLASFDKPRHSRAMLQIVRRFLEGGDDHDEAGIDGVSSGSGGGGGGAGDGAAVGAGASPTPATAAAGVSGGSAAASS